jgi:hypothetical protein
MDETVSSLSDLSSALSAYTADSASSKEPSSMDKAVTELSAYLGPKTSLLDILPEIMSDYRMEPEAIMRDPDPVLMVLCYYLVMGEERTKKMDIPTVHNSATFERVRDLLLQHCRDYCLPVAIVEEFVATLQDENFHMMTVSPEAVGRELEEWATRTAPNIEDEQVIEGIAAALIFVERKPNAPLSAFVPFFIHGTQKSLKRASTLQKWREIAMKEWMKSRDATAGSRQLDI